ncbi:hypothetical protein [Pseudomonas sp. ZS001]|uniref:hypothetical protein n=1 Tax=Pseudomonas sp. ZS001 TaxID=3138070 RepID=UPI0031399A27
MLSKYKIMRGLFKRRSVRILIWNVVALFNKKRLERFCKEQLARRHESFVEFDSNSIGPVVAELEASGAMVGPKLPADTVQYLLSYSENHPCFADRDQTKGFYLKDREKAEALLGKELLLAQYFSAEQDVVIARIANDPYLLSIAARYLKVPPKLMSVNMWWTFPVDASAEDRARHAHVFHFDLDDLKFVKFFFYLTDVDEQAGPHVYVKTSNREIRYKTPLFKSRRFTDDEIVAGYGAENIIEVLGPAGTCLIEDTITVHKGVTPISRARLMLQFEYSINTYSEISCVGDRDAQKIFV